MRRFRLYYDKDAEMEWLNQMASRGYAMRDFKCGIYQFEACEPGAYIYQIDLIDETKGSFEEFCRSIEEAGVEVVSRWARWVYLRKPAKEGAFACSTDDQAKIDQYERIGKFFVLFMFVELFVGITELNIASATGHRAYYILAGALIILAVLFLRMVIRCGLKAKRLRGE